MSLGKAWQCHHRSARVFLRHAFETGNVIHVVPKENR
jgi:hypothetical protein